LIETSFQLFSKVGFFLFDLPDVIFSMNRNLFGEFDFSATGLAMRNRLDGYSSHIAPRADYALSETLAQLKTLGSILRAINLLHLVFVTLGLLGLIYLVTYFYMIQAFDFPQDLWYIKIDELHRQMLHHSIGDRDVAYLVLFLFAFIADNVVLRAGKCMRRAEDHSMAVIGAFVACIPGLSTVSLPFGVMALRQLLKRPVEKKFN
jgi:hypothetical protein